SPAMSLFAGRCAMSTRPSLSTSAQAATSTNGRAPFSAAIRAIDVDVAMRQVTAPDRCLFPPDAGIDLDVDVTALHVRHDLFFPVSGVAHAVARNPDSPDRDLELVAV